MKIKNLGNPQLPLPAGANALPQAAFLRPERQVPMADYAGFLQANLGFLAEEPVRPDNLIDLTHFYHYLEHKFNEAIAADLEKVNALGPVPAGKENPNGLFSRQGTILFKPFVPALLKQFNDEDEDNPEGKIPYIKYNALKCHLEACLYHLTHNRDNGGVRVNLNDLSKVTSITIPLMETRSAKENETDDQGNVVGEKDVNIDHFTNLVIKFENIEIEGTNKQKQIKRIVHVQYKDSLGGALEKDLKDQVVRFIHDNIDCHEIQFDIKHKKVQQLNDYDCALFAIENALDMATQVSISALDRAKALTPVGLLEERVRLVQFIGDPAKDNAPIDMNNPNLVMAYNRAVQPADMIELYNVCFFGAAVLIGGALLAGLSTYTAIGGIIMAAGALITGLGYVTAQGNFDDVHPEADSHIRSEKQDLKTVVIDKKPVNQIEKYVQELDNDIQLAAEAKAESKAIQKKVQDESKAKKAHSAQEKPAISPMYNAKKAAAAIPKGRSVKKPYRPQKAPTKKL